MVPSSIRPLICPFILGHYVPQLAKLIIDSKVKFNLKGIAVSVQYTLIVCICCFFSFNLVRNQTVVVGDLNQILIIDTAYR